MEHTGHWQAADILEETPPESGYPPLGEFLRALAESRLLGEHELRPVLAEHPGLGEGGTPALVAGLTGRGFPARSWNVSGSTPLASTAGFAASDRPAETSFPPRSWYSSTAHGSRSMTSSSRLPTFP